MSMPNRCSETRLFARIARADGSRMTQAIITPMTASSRTRKNFFSDAAVNEKGEDISTREVKEALREIISSEDKNSPLTDEQLTSILSDKGYRIARRTTAKYRESLGFPTARLRREL